tara:strand:+ start:448 stop:990 length:543 start_codon:yes stop_codon:yes gene_type:complete
MPEQPFWNSSTLEPKRKHRWLVYLNNSDIPSYVAKKVDKPSFKVNEMEHKYFGHSFWYPGHVTWNSITLTLVDPIEPDVSAELMSLLESAGYGLPIESGGTLPTVSKADFTKTFGGQIRIEQVTGKENEVIEVWRLHNPWITECKFGDLAHDSDDMLEISLTIRYDWATITGKDNVTIPK